MFVNGNYGFTTVAKDPTTGQPVAGGTESIPVGDYIIAPEIPKDPITGQPVYQSTKEEDINIYSGDEFVPPGEVGTNPPTPAAAVRKVPSPQIPPAICVGPLHMVNVVSDPSLAHFDPNNPSTTSGVYNPDFAAVGGSPFQGTERPMCTSKMVTVRAGRSITPNFFWHTNAGTLHQEVALPGRIYGLVTDDINLSVNSKELNYGEKYGIPGIPIGIYDFADRLVKTVYTDPNGEYEVLLPSTSTFDCLTPDPTCPGMYRFMANDPGQPGHPNPGYNPAYRTIATFSEVYPGMDVQNDIAPLPTMMAIENPGTQNTHPAACLVNDPTTTAPKVPQLFSVSQPYVKVSTGAYDGTITLKGQYFGATQSGGKVTLDGVSMPVISWADHQIVVHIPSYVSAGTHQLLITAGDGQVTPNGLTFHVIGTTGTAPNTVTYTPTLYTVGPSPSYNFNSLTDVHAIQHALDAAAHNAQALVVVYPGQAGPYNPVGSYYENLIVHSPVKIQGVGPGGIFDDGSGFVTGTVLDGLGFGTDAQRDTDWQTTLNSIGSIIGPGGVTTTTDGAAVPEGEVVLFVTHSLKLYTSSFKAAIDGTLIQNGDVADFAMNAKLINYEYLGEIGPDAAGTTANQGGGIVAFASTKYVQITNNIISSNTGNYAGAIRLGSPLSGNNNLDGTHIAYNRIIHNGGNNLAGAIGIFDGVPGYEINNNDICGNFSAEYGGAISHFGLSGNKNIPASIHDNKIYFNGSYDEGAGISIAGDPPPTPTTPLVGSGPVNIYNNRIQANLSNDDGGGIRLLEAGNYVFNIYNNMIVNNVATHEGGGVAIDNAPNVRFFNNTVMKNITTATSVSSNGQPAPAGLATSVNDQYFQATLPPGSPTYSNPLMFNNIFYDNRAGHWNGQGVVGIGGQIWQNGVLVNDPTPINYWDMGVVGSNNQLFPTNSILDTRALPNENIVASPTNIFADPQVKAQYDVSVSASPFSGNPNLIVSAVIIATDVPVTILGDYHLGGTGSPAYNHGAASKTVNGVTYLAPTFDIDNDARPQHGAFDIGADELK
jgi:hypothetical protein